MALAVLDVQLEVVTARDGSLGLDGARLAGVDRVSVLRAVLLRRVVPTRAHRVGGSRDAEGGSERDTDDEDSMNPTAHDSPNVPAGGRRRFAVHPPCLGGRVGKRPT